MSNPELKFWSCSAQFIRKDWERCNIAAYSLKDAKQLYLEVGGTERGMHNHFSNYTSRAWGTPVRKLIPNPKRGVYFTDRTGTSVMYVEPKSRSIIEEIPEAAKVAAAESKVPEKYGHLRVGFDRGVKIDEWVYHSPHADGALADKMKAEVRMRHAKKAHYNDPEKIIFTATSECFGRGTTISGSDISKLFDDVQEAFRTYEVAQRGVVWEEWLEVEISPSHVFSSHDSAGFAVGYRVLMRGIDPRDGRALTINGNNIVRDFPKAKAAGEKEKSKTMIHGEYLDGRDEDHQYAYLPKTPANVAALEGIIDAINSARSKLEGLLVQKMIASTFASIPSVQLIEEKKS